MAKKGGFPARDMVRISLADFDDEVAAAFAAAENRDNLMLARQATEQRLALQREMGVEQPRLLSEHRCLCGCRGGYEFQLFFNDHPYERLPCAVLGVGRAQP